MKYYTERNQRVQRNNRRKRRRILLIGVIILLITAVVIGIQSWTSPQISHGSTSAAGSEQAAVSELTKLKMVPLGKTAPREYNGQIRKIAYLTFDDGPSKYTEQLLDILKQHDIKATFFMQGSNVKGYEKAIKRLADEGHYPGLHSMTHDYKSLYRSGGSENFLKEFNQVQSLIKNITGQKPTLIRAPYGSMPQIGAQFRQEVAGAGFKMWDWSIDSLDWKFPNKPDEVYKQVQQHVKQNLEVILFHEKKQTLDALPKIIQYLKQQGYEFEVYNPNAHIMMNFYKDRSL
ncbi:polysaccharide deacetylase [Paenibacillus sp. N1-5-1-14]|uniref:polysaccharide deacetylase family protein n=1 Tax=Paenibacillus radicibacter TaxID=2972488 RepID=UPI0021592BC9|nr:polysaccharide deacetylase family protein [Paenibacillus radicibacter]MCR8642080.1 polysaccharide deacetylase [Paenibacillus radicibacter]